MTDELCWWLNTPINPHTIYQWCHGSRLYVSSPCPDLLAAARPPSWDWMYRSGFFPPLFNLQQEPLSGIWTNIWICHNPFVCFPFRRLCVHTVSLFQVAMGEMEIYSSNRDDIWSPACFSMLSIARFPRLQSVEDLIITSSFPLNLLAFFGGWRNSGNSFHWPNQTFRSHGMLFHCVLLLNKALHFQWGKRKRMRGRAKEWNMRKLRRTSGPFLTDIGEGGGVGSLSTLHWVS